MNFEGVKREELELEWEDMELGEVLTTGWSLEVSEKKWNMH